jgi:flagellar basal-body rod modification protein FlgD
MNISTLGSNLLNTAAASASTSTASTSTSADSTSMSSLNADDFLKLLLVSLKNQDPSKPMDSTAMLQQFSSLTQVQQTQKTNGYLLALLQTELALTNSQAVGFIGKNISYSGGQISVAGGTAGTSQYSLAGNASTVTATIYDANGTAVKTVELGSKTTGSYSFQWDGTNSSGTKVADGTYTVSIAAKDSAGKNISAATEGTANVTGVTFRNGMAYLMTNVGEIALAAVTGVNG